MSFNKLNKVMAVVTVLATISCLIPESAEALPPALVSGASINGSFVFFEVASNSDNFSDIIKNFRFGLVDGNSSMCQSNFEGIIGFDEFKNQESGNTLKSCVGFNFANLELKENGNYEATFNTDDSNFLFVEGFTQEYFKDLNHQLMLEISFINDTYSTITVKNVPPTSGEPPFEEEQWNNYTYNFQNGGSECLDAEFPDPNNPVEACNIEIIPEPSGTTSLLGAGAIGAVSLLKRHKRYRKPASSRLNLSEEKTRT